MQTLRMGPAVRPLPPLPTTNYRFRRDKVTARAARVADDDLERLESFFGEPYTARRHHRRGQWVESEYVEVPVEQAEAPAEQAAAPAPAPAVEPAPLPAAPAAEARPSALDQLSRLTTEQLSNLEAASRHAAEVLREGASAAQGQTGRLVAAAQHQAEQAQAVLSCTADSLKQRVASGRAASTAPPAPAPAPAPAAVQRKQKATPAAAPVAAAPSLRDQFRAEVHQGLDSLRSLSAAQLRNLEEAARSVRSSVASKADQFQAMVATRLQETEPPMQQQNQQQQQPERDATQKKAAAPAAAAPKAEAGPVPVWVASLRERLPTVSVSVPAPLAALPGEAERLRAALAANPRALAVGGVAVVLAAMRWVALSAMRRGDLAEQEALSRARSRRALDRQRARFKQALDGKDKDAAGIDTSVFSAVKQIRTTAAASAAAAAAGEEEEGDAAAAMDPELRRQWEAFVRGSRLSDAEMWDPAEVDEGLPEVYVTFEDEEED